MNKVIIIIILTLILTPLSSSLALHDDEAIGKGGAWESEGVRRDQQTPSEKDTSIDLNLDKTFRKSPIVIPSTEPEPDQSDTFSTDLDDPRAPFPHRD